MQWVNEKIIELIESYRLKKVLWDPTNNKYRDKLKRKEAFEEISQKLGIPIEELDKKLHGLRTQFQREHRKTTNSTWFAYQHLKFLLTVSNTPRKSSKFKIEKIENNTSIEEQQPQRNDSINERSENDATQDEIFELPKKFRGETIVNPNTSFDENNEQFRKPIIISQGTTMPPDPLVIFGKYVTEELKTVNDPYSVQLAKKKINQILFEATTGDYKRVDID